jgi:flagellar secretion chaperone FliS
MNQRTSDSYLATEIMTSTPQKLQLMLLDAAIREGELARKHWQAQENKQAEKSLLRALQIMYSVLGGIDLEVKSELVGKVAGVYLFICQALTRAFVDNDANKLAEALRVLAVERETWRQLCEKLAQSPADQPPPKTGFTPDAHIPASLSGTSTDLPATSFSLEA